MKKSPRLSATEGLAFSQEKTLAWKDDRERAGCDWNLPGGCRQGGPGAVTPSHPPQVWKPEQTSAFRSIVLTQSTSTFYFLLLPGLCFEAVWGMTSSQNTCPRMIHTDKAGFAVGYHFGFLLNSPFNTQELSVKRFYLHICLHSYKCVCPYM